MDRELQSAIFMLCMFIALSPVYIYLLLKWYKLRQHFVIANRFPNISIAVFISSILSQLFSIAELFTRIHYFHIISTVLFSVSLGLIFHRTHLIYVRWSIHAKYLQTMTSFQSKLSNPNHDDTHPTRCTSLMTTVIFVIIVVIFPAMMLFLSFLPEGAHCSELVCQMIIGTFLAIRTFRSNVSESLDCIKESAITISSTFIVAFLPMFLTLFIAEYTYVLEHVATTSSFCASSVIGCCALYIGIRLIHKVENSKNTTENSLAIIHHPAVICATSTHNRHLTLDVTTSTTSSARSTSPTPTNLSDTPVSIQKTELNQSLVHFLKTQKHYELLAGYMSECFALENLSFLERGILLHHLILKYKALDSQFVAKQKESDTVKWDNYQFYDLSFDYLAQIYVDMERVVKEAVPVETDENDEMR
eukprot:195949_1